MTKTVNKAILVGHVARDPELQCTSGGKSYCRFSVATEGWSKNEADFHSVVCWNETAERMAEWLHKGDLVYVEGKISPQSWEDKDGVKRNRTDIIGFTVNILHQKSRAKRDDDGSTERPRERKPVREPERSIPPEDEIPF